MKYLMVNKFIIQMLFFFTSENKAELCLGYKLSGELERPQLTWNNFVLDLCIKLLR